MIFAWLRERRRSRLFSERFAVARELEDAQMKRDRHRWLEAAERLVEIDRQIANLKG